VTWRRRITGCRCSSRREGSARDEKIAQETTA
jgi:hypothetical protein